MALYVHEQWDFGNSNWSTQEKFHNLVEDSFSAADSVWFGSNATRRHWESSGFPMNALTIPTTRNIDFRLQNGNHLLKFEARKFFAIEENIKVFLSIATFEKRKRIEDAIYAFKTLNRPDTQLFLVGSIDGMYSQYIKDLAADDPRIRIFPIQANLINFYQAADFFVFTSGEETMPLVLQEASLFGLPRIVSKYNGFEELISSDEEAFLFQTGEIEELITHMNHALSDSELARKVGLIGLEKQLVRQVENANLLLKTVANVSQISITLTPAIWRLCD